MQEVLHLAQPSGYLQRTFSAYLTVSYSRGARWTTHSPGRLSTLARGAGLSLEKHMQKLTRAPNSTDDRCVVWPSYLWYSWQLHLRAARGCRPPAAGPASLKANMHVTQTKQRPASKPNHLWRQEGPWERSPEPVLDRQHRHLRCLPKQ